MHKLITSVHGTLGILSLLSGSSKKKRSSKKNKSKKKKSSKKKRSSKK